MSKLIWPESFINKVICGDCLEAMKEIPDNSVDLVITSPPYYEKNIRGHNKKSSPLYKEFFIPFVNIAKEWFEGVYRIVKEDGMVFINLGFNVDTGWAFPFKLIKHSPFMSRDLIMWEKRNPEPNSMGGLTHTFEFIFIFHKMSRPNYKGIKKGEYVKDVWKMSVGKDAECSRYWSKFYHGAMFPIELPQNCLRIASKEGDIVLDPFLGSGTTAIACKKLGRNYIGIELNKDYCKIAEERIKRTAYQTSLF